MPGFREQVAQIHAGRSDLARYDRHMGFRFTEMSDGRAVVECPDASPFLNPTGVAHGGLLFGLADSAVAYALSTQLAPVETCTTIESSIHFLRPVRAGPVRAEARVVRAGRTVCLIDCEITDSEGRTVAKCRSTFLRLQADEQGSWRPPGAEKPR